MKEGESKTAHIPPDQGYGPHQEEMMMVLPRNQFPPDFRPQVGQQLQMQTKSGETFMVAVSAVTDVEVTLDANHPLAGKDLTFDIKLVKID
jgi:peptidylprolyl isomerase